ncbi:DUF6318 family protein [Isoptericola sp. 178]|uniref:DUF6318 family protein n=1 Tax=Isoptericola sp. 178 TaxID=3064651 RepID=UPI002713D57D|nr:DUF6318 family protein [Isoptericola sp. 178]MDO8144529.1 DUF6318 family protein [Isoptericola sp. 178]
MARTPRHRSPLRRLVPALVVLGLLAGCTGGDPEPEAQASEPASAPATTAPSEEPTPSPSPSPTGPTKPERPAAMDRKDEKGAAAAAAHFLELRAPMMATGETRAWEAMSHRACDFCESGFEQARKIAARGDAYTGGEASIEILETYGHDSLTGIFPVDLRLTEEPSSITDKSGAVLFSTKRTVTELRIEVGTRDGEWVIVGVGEPS